jgi:hypothetical protein
MKKNVVMIIFITIASVLLPLKSMQPIQNSDNTLAWSVILTAGVSFFNYKMITKLAVSKSHQILLENTAPLRKRYFEEILTFPYGLVWHKYGAMAAIVNHHLCLLCGSSPKHFSLKKIREYRWSGLCLHRYYLGRDGRYFHAPSEYYSKYYSCLPNTPAPFFNASGDLCVYAYNLNNWKNEKSGTVTNYVWHSSIKPGKLNISEKKCMTNIPNKDGKLLNLTLFLEFPTLFKAFMNSSIIYEEFHHRTPIKKIYAIEGVTIPEDYAYHRQYFAVNRFNSFNDLSPDIRKAIYGRYLEKQQR